jgi:choline dehydrogenase
MLKSLGIKTEVELPGVGENLLEQPNHLLINSGHDLDPSLNAYHTFVTAADLFGTQVKAVEESIRANIPRWARAVVDASGPGALNVTAVEQLLRQQHDLLFSKNVPAAEILTVVAGSILASNYWILFPFSRGSVHLGSANAIDKPLIDPRILLADIDLTMAVATGKLARKFWLTKPINDFVTGPVSPGPDVLPENATDMQWESFTRETCKMVSPVEVGKFLTRCYSKCKLTPPWLCIHDG